jgi:parallel beta-helix repeat protein
MFRGLHISGNNSQVTYNEIYGSSRIGLLFEGHGVPTRGEGTYCSHNTFEYNYIHDNEEGISTWPAPYDYTYDNVFHHNRIEDNTNYGLLNGHIGEVIDARYNWWGHATGPLEVDEVGSEENPHGASALGDSVSDDVDFIPWYATPTTTSSTEYVSLDHNPIIAYSDTIQGGVDAALNGDTINVAAGTYTEQIIINKDLILQGASGAKIVSPDTRNKYMILESSAVWDPIIFAFGGTLSGDTVIGSDTVSVFIDNFEIDGSNKAASGRYVGILYRNVDKGVISNISIHHMFDADGEGDGPQTFGILVYGDSDVTIENNDISDFSYGGIGAIGVSGSTDPIATVQGNTVTGNGLEIWPGWWAEYGIQISMGAGGNVIDNEIRDCRVYNPGWPSFGMGIMVYSAAHGVNILNCQVTNCDIGIDVATSSYDLIDGNNVTYCRYDGIRLRLPTDHITVTNNICHHNLWGMTAFDASDNLIQNNDLYGNDHGIWIDGASDNNDILDNDIHDNDVDGIRLSKNGDKKPKGTEIHHNRIHGNGVYGIENYDLLLAVDATNNWMGHPTGPYHPSQWPYNGAMYGPNYGEGDTVSNYVLYDDWKLGQQVVTIDVTPTSLNLQSKGNYMSLKITALGFGYTMDQIDGETLRMLSVIPAESYGVTGQSFSAKFDRAEFEDITAPGEVEVLVIGKFLDGSWFYGFDTITAHM